MKQYSIEAVENGELIIHVNGDNSNYEVIYNHGEIIFQNEFNRYIIPSEAGNNVVFPRNDPNTGKMKYDLFNIRALYRDTTPTDFNFNSLVDIEPGSTQFSNEIVIGGVNEQIEVIVPMNVAIHVNGTLKTGTVLVDSGDVLKFEFIAGFDGGTTSNFNISIGDITRAFSITTALSALFNFLNHTFTSGGRGGRFGPTLADLLTAYSSSSWSSDTTQFNMTTTGIQLWTVPETATYRITSAGAQGGYGGNHSGGTGAIMRGDFNLVEGEVLSIIIGHKGVDANATDNCAGGGGGSFVWKNILGVNGLYIAGGGGGGASSVDIGNLDASITTVAKDGYHLNELAPTSRAGTSGNGGNGGNGSNRGVGGAGWYSDSAQGGLTAQDRKAIKPTSGGIGGIGGREAAFSSQDGGFGGGGGGGDHSTCAYGGGGGGYTGGGGGSWNGTSSGGGGGAGSKNNGTNQTNTTGNTNNGYVIVEKI